MVLTPVPIPADIWLHVSQFIPPDDLRDMLDVNRTFFQLAMAERYRVVFLPGRFFINQTDRVHGLRDRARYIRKLVFAVDFDFPLNHGILQTMTDVVACFTNVTEFFIEWTTPSPSAKDLLPFLTAAWKAFDSTLQTIDFRVPVTYLPKLLSTVGSRIAPSALAVFLEPEIHSDGRDMRGGMCEVLTTVLAPFINKVSPNLRRLKLQVDIYNVKLLPFFQHLGSIPNLEHFDFPIYNDAELFSNPLGMTRFFHNHTSSLRHLFMLDNKPWDPALTGLHPTHKYVTDWLSANQGDTTLLSNLLTLHWTLPDSRGQFDLLVPYVRRSADTLTTLRLDGNYLCYEEVQTLTSVLVPRSQTSHLKELWITVEYVMPELVTLLARTFPRLKSLVIDADSVAACTEVYVTSWDEVQEHFAANMRMCKISDWPLHTIEIKMSEREYQSLFIARRLMWVLAECIPSVKMFGNVLKETLAMKPDSYL